MLGSSLAPPATFGVVSVDVDRRARLFRRGRIVVLALVIAYFFLPYWIQAAIPVWLLFLAALGLEVEFFLGGYLQGRRGQPAPAPDRGPQQRDLTDLGIWAWWDQGAAAALPEAESSRFRWIHVAEAAVGIVARRGDPLLRLTAERLGRGRRRGPRAHRGSPLARGLARRRPSGADRLRHERPVRRLRPGRGRARLRRRRARLPDAVDLQHALPARGQAPYAVVHADGPRARRPRARVVAPPRRAQRGPRQLLRLPERRRDRRQPRPLRENGARDDARAARDECLRLRRATCSTGCPVSVATEAPPTCIRALRVSRRHPDRGRVA